MFGDDELIKIHRRRATQVGNIILLCFGVILARLWYLQIYKGETFHEWSIQNRLRKEVVRAPRGMMFSRDNELIVDNIPRFDAILTRQFLRNKEETYARLSDILNIPVKDIKKTIRKHSFQAKYRPIIIKKNINLTEVARIETENAFLPGVSVDTFISREYKDNEVGAHALGYISEITQEQLPRYRKRDKIPYALGDFIGQAGLESELDPILRGENGHEFVEVDALGRKKKYINIDNLFKGISDKAATPGRNVRLTLDRDLQLAAHEALAGRTGAVVAMDVRTGQILSMVSTPSFNPSSFARGLSSEEWARISGNPENPLWDRSIQEHYNPGSTFKPFTAIAALEEGVINDQTKIRCHGIYKLGNRVYHSWKRWGTTKVSITNAIRESCNIFFYKVATDLDIDALAKYAKMFGFGKKTGVALPREVSGLIPSKEWKKKRFGTPWQKGETLSCSIGQSYVQASLLQLVRAYSAIANKGHLYRPYLVDEIYSPTGELLKKMRPELIRKIELSDTTWNLVQNGLYKVVNDPKGTAWWRRGVGNQMAGKTGTSQVVKATSEEQLYAKCKDKEYKFRHHALFVGYAPFTDPHIAVGAIVEHGCSSSASAAVVEKVVSTYMKKYLPEKQKLNAEKERAQYKNYMAKIKAAQEKDKEEEESD